MKNVRNIVASLFISVLLTACATVSPAKTNIADLKVLAAESLIADIAQNIAGDRIVIQTLIPDGYETHSFQPTPQDVSSILKSDLFIMNGGGYEGWMSDVTAANATEMNLVEASHGLEFRHVVDDHSAENEPSATDEHLHELGDPHFWTDPNNVIKYAENIRDALIALDPEGKSTYEQNTIAYIKELNDLDIWIKDQVNVIPAEKRIIITNHDELGYFADHYGFEVVGTLLEGTSSESSASSQHIVDLINTIKEHQVNVVFIELVDDPALAAQIQEETGIRIINELNTHSLMVDGKTTSYIEVTKNNVLLLTELK